MWNPRLFAFVLFLVLSSVLFAQSAPRTIQVHGHRGARAARPENTIPAFEYAIAAGADVLELDMSVTRDNVIVISHDPVLHEPICTGPASQPVIRELTLAQVKQWDCGATRNPSFATQQTVPGTRMPTLDEVFALAPKGHFGFNIETKISVQHPERTPPPEEFVRMVLDAIRKHHLEARIILQSFDFRTLQAMKKLAPEIKLAALYSGPTRAFTDIARESGASIVSPTQALVTPEQVKAAHQAGLTVVPWTANKPEEWERLVNASVDGIITDDPAGLIAWLKQRGLR